MGLTSDAYILAAGSAISAFQPPPTPFRIGMNSPSVKVFLVIVVVIVYYSFKNTMYL